MPYTATQRAQIMAETRKSFADSPHKPAVVWKSIEQDIVDNRSEIAALRVDVNALNAQVETLSRMVSGLVQDMSEFRAFVKSAPQPGGNWWEWVDERIDAEVSELSRDTEQAVGHVADRSRIEFDEQAGEIALLKRELSVLRGEVGVERELRELRQSVWKAQKAIPRVPTIVAGMRDEAEAAKRETDRQLAELRKQAQADRRALAQVTIKQGVTAAALKRGLAEGVEFEFEQTSHSTRAVIRPALHPDAAKTLREFAGQVIDGTIIQH